MKTLQVTGLGPMAEDGSIDIFTVLPQPFHVTPEWLAAQSHFPAPGHELVLADDGSISLTASELPGAASDDEAQKKTMVGSAGSASGLQTSQLPVYSSKATTITAGKIIGMETGADENGSLTVVLEDNSMRKLPKGNICGVGDYWCTDGAYEWFMPAAMFNDKFEA